jgi:K+-sensing histidine kinase KdpD
VNVNELYPKTEKYLKAANHVGQTIQARISAVEAEVFKDLKSGEESYKAVLYFVGQKLGLVLSPSNARNLAEQLGAETATWAGKDVTISTKRYDINGNVTHGFILTGASPAKVWGQDRSEPNDDIPF